MFDLSTAELTQNFDQNERISSSHKFCCRDTRTRFADRKKIYHFRPQETLQTTWPSRSFTVAKRQHRLSNTAASNSVYLSALKAHHSIQDASTCDGDQYAILSLRTPVYMLTSPRHTRWRKKDRPSSTTIKYHSRKDCRRYHPIMFGSQGNAENAT